MSAMTSRITSLTIVYSIVYSCADQRKHHTPRHWHLWGEFTGDRWIPRTKGQLRGKCFHLMTSSWKVFTSSLAYTWWRHNMETHSTRLALCQGNQSLTDGFPAQNASIAEFWWFCCSSEHVSKQHQSGGDMKNLNAFVTSFWYNRY